MSRRARSRGGERTHPQVAPDAGRSPGRPTAAAAPAWLVLLGAALVTTAIAAWSLARQRLPILPAVASIAARAEPALAAALDNAAAAIRHAPGSALAWGELGVLLAAHGHDDEAIACFREAAGRDENSWRWPFFAAVVAERSDPSAGVTLLGEALERDPTASWPRLLRAEWLAGRGDVAAAGDDFATLLSREPDHARAHLSLARLRLAEGDPRAARDAIGPARDHPSTRRGARELDAQIALRDGDPAAARRLLEEASALPPDEPWPADPLAAEIPGHTVGKRGRLALVGRLEQSGDRAAADAVARRVEEESPEVAWFVEGRLRAARGDLAGAEDALRRSLAIDARAPETHWELGRTLAAAGRGSEAADAFRTLLAIEPAHGPAWLELGRVLLPSDRAAAARAFAQAAAYMPDSEDARRELSVTRGGADADEQRGEEDGR